MEETAFYEVEPWFMARKNEAQPMRPYVPGEDMKGVSVSGRNTPEEGGMIAVSPNDSSDKWYINPKFFKENYHRMRDLSDANESFLEMSRQAIKTLHNSDISGAKQNVPDIVVFGDGDAFKLISKASSKCEDWMKSTKAYEIPGYGCLVQVTTQQGDHVAEALCFVPGVKITIRTDGTRRIVMLNS